MNATTMAWAGWILFVFAAFFYFCARKGVNDFSAALQKKLVECNVLNADLNASQNSFDELDVRHTKAMKNIELFNAAIKTRDAAITQKTEVVDALTREKVALHGKLTSAERTIADMKEQIPPRGDDGRFVETPGKPLSDMSRQELRNLAESMGLSFGTKATRQEMIEAIKKATV